jgi:hypothetical protein
VKTKLEIPARLYPVSSATTSHLIPIHNTVEGVEAGVVLFRGEGREGVGAVTSDSIVVAASATESKADFQIAIPSQEFKRILRDASDGLEGGVECEVDIERGVVESGGRSIQGIQGSDVPAVAAWIDVDKCDAVHVKRVVINREAIRRVIVALAEASPDEVTDIQISIIETRENEGYVTFSVDRGDSEKLIGVVRAIGIATESSP